MKKILLVLIMALSIVGCTNNENGETSTVGNNFVGENVVSYVSNIIGSDSTVSEENAGEEKSSEIDNEEINSEENEAITPKYTFLSFVATWCPHCQDEVPVLDEFYSEHIGETNMLLLVQDKKEFPGVEYIPQDYTSPLSYEEVTGEACGYIPSYVIYDENKQIVDKQCGAQLTKEDLENKLLNTNTTLDNNQTIPMSDLQSAGFENGDLGVILTTTNGKIEIKMFPEEAPKTVMNFLGLAAKGYYDGLTFHRVINNFMIQGGDPEGTGMGGESIYGSAFEDEFNANLGNYRGSLAMANSGENTNGSQFFINQTDNNYLDYKHTVFGQVINGLDNVDKIAKSKTDSNNKPVKDVKIIKAEVVKYEDGTLKAYDYNFDEEFAKYNEAKADLVAENGDAVEVNYILTDNDTGEEYDNSYTRGSSLSLVIGEEGTLVKFNQGLIGMKIGEKKTLVLSPSEAYGELNNPDNIKEFDRSEFAQFEEAGYTLEVGSTIPTQYGNLKIVGSTENTISIDFTHQLAGKTLKFEVEMMNISKASQ